MLDSAYIVCETAPPPGMFPKPGPAKDPLTTYRPAQKPTTPATNSQVRGRRASAETVATIRLAGAAIANSRKLKPTHPASAAATNHRPEIGRVRSAFAPKPRHANSQARVGTSVMNEVA